MIFNPTFNEEESWVRFAAAGLAGIQGETDSEVNPEFAIKEAAMLTDKMMQKVRDRRAS